MEANKPLFRDLNADDPDPEATEIESLCMNCHANGITRLLLTKIPFYKEVVLMSFTCEHCGYQNNEIQSGASVSDKGVRFELNVKSERDLNRQVVKSDYANIKLVEIDFEIPPKSQKGEVTTVEGIINRVITGLNQDQPVRKIEHPEVASQIDDVIKKLQKLKDLEEPFTLILEDISGNSFIENPNTPKIDEGCKIHYFVRNKEQDHELGMYTKEEITGEKETAILHPIGEEYTLKDVEGEVMQFPTNCFNCGSPCTTNMKMTNIPHFKEVVIMATTCEVCGYRTNEVKSGSGIESKGLKMEVDVNSKDDFSRDILKSETCSLKIPQLQLEVGPHALGGRFTTVEGLMQAIKEQLCDPQNSHLYMFGDSQEPKSKKQFEEFIKKFDKILEGELPITLELDDPAGNSYIQSMRDDDQVDEGLRITHYERSFEQNEELGLNDMKTENYESKIIDVDMKSSFCNTCNKKKSELCLAEFPMWYEDHKLECSEANSAVAIFKISQELFNVIYGNYIGDGDSKTYTTVVDSKPYGDNVEINKLECVLHVGSPREMRPYLKCILDDILCRR